DYLVSCLDPENLEPTLNDYYLCQLTSDYFEKQKIAQSSLSCSPDPPSTPDLSCYSLSLNSVTSESSPVLPEAYKEFAPLFQDRELGVLPPSRPFDHSIPLEAGATVPFVSRT